jgi:multidrug resistance protein
MTLRDSRSFAAALVAFATFIDIVAYSIAVPVLPDLTRRLGATPTTIGFLFASFGVTLLVVSIPMGAISDRVGRKMPMVAGLLALAAATAMFAFAGSLPSLFTARLIQGAADAVTWVVGFALIADLYGPAERGRVTGVIMAIASFAFMIGPTLGGWLYELGGIRLPFLALAAAALVGAAPFAWIRSHDSHAEREQVPIGVALREPAIRACVLAVVAVSATMSMLEPVLALHLQTRVGLGPAQVGLVFGAVAVSNMAWHPLFGRAADSWGARRLTIAGLFAVACTLPIAGRMWSFESAIGLGILQSAAFSIVITPSLAYMADAVSASGQGAFGVAYGLYNMAWGVGLLGGPALGGFLFERMGFSRLTLAWAPVLALATMLLARARSGSEARLKPDATKDDTVRTVRL